MDCSVAQAGGYLIQLLPGATEEEIDKIEAGVAQLGAITPALDSGLGAEDILRKVLSGFTLEVLEESPVAYRCGCSRDRVTRALISMGAKDLREMAAEQGEIDLTCQFCDKVYHFTKNELEEIAQKAGDKECEAE